MYKTLILSIGNDLRGDDGAGKAILERLRSLHSLPTSVDTKDCGAGDLLTVLMNPDVDKVIIVDAADMNLQPGAWRRFQTINGSWEILNEHPLGTTHGLGVFQAILLGKILGTLPKEIVIFGVQPQTLDYHQGLSEPVVRTVTEVCDAIKFELESTQTTENPPPIN